jgi:hypothetical protein
VAEHNKVFRGCRATVGSRDHVVHLEVPNGSADVTAALSQQRRVNPGGAWPVPRA